MKTSAPEETQQAIKSAIENGYHFIETFAGILPFEEWLSVTALTSPLQYENGKLVTEWFDSILEKGKKERLVFKLH